MVGAVNNEPSYTEVEGARREVAAPVPGVVRAVAGRQLQTGRQQGRGRLQGHRAAEGAVAVGRRADAALYLHRTEQRAVAVHVGPEDTLVLGRVEGHTVERHVDTRVAGTTDAHIGGSRSHAVLAPCQDAGRLSKEERQLAPRLGEVAKFLFLNVTHGVRCILLRTHTAYHHFREFLHLRGVVERRPILGIHTGRHHCSHCQQNNLFHTYLYL